MEQTDAYWTEILNRYCERAADASWLAEPVNVVTNIGFFIAALMAYRHWRRQPASARDVDGLIFIALAASIGVASTCFHTLGQRWAYFFDLTPLSLFILVYLNYALIRFLELTPAVSFLATGAFALTLPLIAALPGGGLGLLNGSIGLVPTLIALLAIAWLVHGRGHPAGRGLLIAGTIFTVAFLFRTMDRAVCELTTVADHAVGTHGIWHLLNAVVLYLLLTNAMDHGRHNEQTYEVLPPGSRAGSKARSETDHARDAADTHPAGPD